jgi:alkylhydroperoxidase family enzyme
VAGHRILEEQVVALIDDDYETSALDERAKALLRFTDVFLTDPTGLPDEVRDAMLNLFSDEEIVECTLYAAIASGFSKMLIVLGAEPREMPLTVAPVEAFAADPIPAPSGTTRESR